MCSVLAVCICSWRIFYLVFKRLRRKSKNDDRRDEVENSVDEFASQTKTELEDPAMAGIEISSNSPKTNSNESDEIAKNRLSFMIGNGNLCRTIPTIRDKVTAPGHPHRRGAYLFENKLQTGGTDKHSTDGCNRNFESGLMVDDVGLESKTREF